MIKNVKTVLLSLVSVWVGGVAVVATDVYSYLGTIPVELLTSIALWPWSFIQYWVS